MIITVEYPLSQEGQKVAILSGQDPHRGRVDTYQDVDAPLLKRILEVGEIQEDGNVLLKLPLTSHITIGRKCVSVEQYDGGGRYTVPQLRNVDDFPVPSMKEGADKPLSLEEVVTLLEHVKAAYVESAAAALEEYNRLKPAADARRAELKAEEKARREEADRRQHEDYEARMLAQSQANERLEKEREEREEWVKQHGSERLKLALEMGMLNECQSVYEEEWLAKEHPGFILDRNWHNGNVEYTDALNPELDSLMLLKDIRTRLPEAELSFAKLVRQDDYGSRKVVVKEKVITANVKIHDSVKMIVYRYTKDE